ncbi:MAG TPA: 3-oxoacyl-[acyl-carrier-protein] synthase III C-terminal domain-containing protein, partial [Verrucomicrobiae bacterium]|nr:3-oxoacyl-[acyl-carrier-protein] synthase III C-terminal domain-containing protein [Verrucomicrobiae bacterium]
DRFPEDKSKLYVHMNGPNIFNFTLKRVPALLNETLAGSGVPREAIDYFIFHQSNRFIMRHLASKCGISEDRIPRTIEEFGSTGGPSVPLTITKGKLNRAADRSLQLLLLTYGVGLSWGSAVLDLPPDAVLNHLELSTGTNDALKNVGTAAPASRE